MHTPVAVYHLHYPESRNYMATSWWTVTLPGICIVLVVLSVNVIGDLELSRGYVRSAHARGFPFSLVVVKHALRNALMPVITILGLELGTLIGGAIIIETVFAWPGMGQLIYEAISARDYPLAQTGLLIVGSLLVVLSLFVDIAYACLDPRIGWPERTGDGARTLQDRPAHFWTCCGKDGRRWVSLSC